MKRRPLLLIVFVIFISSTLANKAPVLESITFEVNQKEQEVVIISKMELQERLPVVALAKVQEKLWKLTGDNTSRVIVQIREGKKAGVQNKVKTGDPAFDDTLLFADATGNEVAALAVDPSVVKIWPDLQMSSLLDQSAVQIHADYLWDLNLTGSDVRIAILDTGVDAGHEMLSGRVVAQEDFTGAGATDAFGHGTHVAGIAAGNGSYKGVAYEALLYNGKVLDDSGSGYLSWLINGIDWAIQQEADIISLSLGAAFDGSPEEYVDAPEVLKIEEAISQGIIVVIASGNCGSGYCGSFGSVTTPGIARNAITVGAVDDADNWAAFSSGDYIADYIKPDVVAPGVGICSSVPNGYACYSGTSMATPHVAGAAALLLDHNQTLRPYEIKAMLEGTAIDLGEAGKDTKYGSGLIDLSSVLSYALLPPEPIPTGDYELVIPSFTIGEKGSIVLKYYNDCKQCKPQKFTVRFDVEELDSVVHESFTKTIPPGKFRFFSVDFTPMVPGKHLLKVTVQNETHTVEEIVRGVDVGVEAYTNTLGNVRLVR